MQNINKFCEQTGFQFQEGECGFGRPCVGILVPNTKNWLDYEHYNTETYDVIASNTAAQMCRPPNAYHKHNCLSVLTSNITREAAIKELDDWLGKIMEKPFKISEYTDTHSASAFFSGRPMIQKVLVDG